MLRDGHEISWRNAGYSYWWNRSCVPAPRKRNCAERRRDGEALRALLDARGTSARGRREDVEVSWKFLYAARFVRERVQAVDVALRAGQRAVPQAAQFHVRRIAAGGKFGGAPSQLRCAPGPGEIPGGKAKG